MSGPADLALAACHWLEYVGLLGGLGSFAVRRLGRLSPRIAWANPPMQLAFAAALLGGLGQLALGFSWPLLARVVAEGVALVLCVRGIGFVAVVAVIAVMLLPLTSHAARAQEVAGAELVDALHVLSAGMWAGGILALASLRPPGGWNGAEARTLLERFGRIAFIAFAITALTGVLRATEQLNDVGDLWTTAYGLVLTLKSVGVLATLAMSLAWRRGWPAARAEAFVAMLVVGATAVLASLPFPSEVAALSR